MFSCQVDLEQNSEMHSKYYHCDWKELDRTGFREGWKRFVPGGSDEPDAGREFETPVGLFKGCQYSKR